MHSEALTRAEVRRVDEIAIRKHAIAGIKLMENAGRGIAELLRAVGISGKVTVCCGGGNNGGDGFVVARHFQSSGITVQVLLFSDPNRLRGDAALSYQAIAKTGLPIRAVPADADYEAVIGWLTGSDWIVDALLGTGTTSLPRPPYVEAIRAINTAAAGGVRVLAVDLPSGLDADAGEPFRDETGKYGACVKADLTATMVARKTGFDRPSAREFTGDVFVIDIGVPPEVIVEAKRSEGPVRELTGRSDR
jgi:NAD(P)H-hydrate epimerase